MNEAERIGEFLVGMNIAPRTLTLTRDEDRWLLQLCTGVDRDLFLWVRYCPFCGVQLATL